MLAVIIIQITDVGYTEHGSCREFEKVKTLKSFRPQDKIAVFKKC